LEYKFFIFNDLNNCKICTYRKLLLVGKIISTKRDELDNILTMMNIQVDNPISVLNQDVSRTFLVTSKPDEKYNLFMKATLLDSIKNNYEEALSICEEEYTKLNQHYEVCIHYIYFILSCYNSHFLCQALSQVKGEIQRLKENIHRLEEMDESRAELNNLEMELQWATVNLNLKKIEITKIIFRVTVL